MVKAARDRFGRLDFLDNNVGIGSRGSVVDETEENWRRVMQVNVEPCSWPPSTRSRPW